MTEEKPRFNADTWEKQPGRRWVQTVAWSKSIPRGLIWVETEDTYLGFGEHVTPYALHGLRKEGEPLKEVRVGLFKKELRQPLYFAFPENLRLAD